MIGEPTGLDAAMFAWEDAKRAREQCATRSKAAALGHRRRVLADPDAHPLARTRATKNLTVAELSARSTVSERTIRAIEAGERASDATWTRLCLGLGGERRERIDPHHVR